MTWEALEESVQQWARARCIIPNATPTSQLLKAVSEIGELCDAEGKQDCPEMVDAIGDVLVCLINYCALRGFTMTQCLAAAYEQIKDRKGTLMSDGTFVKE